MKENEVKNIIGLAFKICGIFVMVVSIPIGWGIIKNPFSINEISMLAMIALGYVGTKIGDGLK